MQARRLEWARALSQNYNGPTQNWSLSYVPYLASPHTQVDTEKYKFLSHPRELIWRNHSLKSMIYWKLHAWTEEYISAFVSWYQVSSVRFPVWTKTEDNWVHLAICLQIKRIGMLSIIVSLSVPWLLSLCFCLCDIVFVFLSLWSLVCY